MSLLHRSLRPVNDLRKLPHGHASPERRAFLALCASAIVAGCADEQSRVFPPYCAIDFDVNADVDLRRLRARSSTGNDDLDGALIAELQRITRVMSVNPGFRIVDEKGRPNSFALERTHIDQTQGTVLFGQKQLDHELAVPQGGLSVAGIAAHECAHIYQFFSGTGKLLQRDQKTRSRMELHADFLAGYYLGRDRSGDVDIKVFAQSLYGMGDWNFNDPLHHGTPERRIAAMSTGYWLGRRGVSFDAAVAKGIEHVSV